MRAAGLRSQTGYGKRRFKRGGAPSVVAPSHLQRQFDVTEPNKVWVTDITYIRTQIKLLVKRADAASARQ